MYLQATSMILSVES